MPSKRNCSNYPNYSDYSCQPNDGCCFNIVYNDAPNIQQPPIVVSYVTTLIRILTVPSSTVGVAPVDIPPNSTIVPPGTVTVINSFSTTPINNNGGIIPNYLTGFFTIPVSGRYNIAAYLSFSANPNGIRNAFIYRQSAANSTINVMAKDSRNAVSVGTTNIAIGTNIDFNAGDKVFFAVSQNSGSTLNINIDGRLTLVRIN